ncbi:MAG: eukaryotic-like serine/threonine-protein kinase [Candidatus Sumerlaeota bacterium]|nr:eukaryotic-like serine/threonine-protein kinase [Candidatus Sumerlaeota bacterium]
MIDLDVGDIIAGKYEIKRVLGAGGMGKVYRARQVDLGRDVALKVPSQAVLESPDIMARFSREARTVAKLMHDNIVQVYEYYHEDDLAFIAMEFVEGEDLKGLVSRSPKDLTVGDMATILERSCEGLAHAHEYGIVHRDVKPHNIMIARAPRGRWRVKVMDFGIAHIDSTAQFTEMDGGQLTQTGQALGTPSYMAPEQIRGTGVSHLSDIYSFGCVIYFCFTQQTVFTGSGLTVAVAHLNEQPPSIRSIIPTISSEFDQLILRCLEKDPSRRPQEATELGQALKQVLEPMKDVTMEQIWRETRQASNATIPIIQTPTAPSAAGGASHKLEEVKTQGTLGQTGLTDSKADSAPTLAGEPIREAGAAGAEGSATMTGEPLVEAPASLPAAQQPAQGKSKAMMLVGGIAAACLVIGVLAVVGLKALGGGGTNGNNGGATPTPQPTQSAETSAPTETQPGAQPTPVSTSPGATPKETQVAIAVTPRPTPEARPTTPPPPTPQPTPRVSAQQQQLADLEFEFRNAPDFIQRLVLWDKAMGLVLENDPEFTRRVLDLADLIAISATKSPVLDAAPFGSFTMGFNPQWEGDAGFDQTPHNVTVSRFEMGRYEVSALEFATFLNANKDDAASLFQPGSDTNVVYDEKLERYRPRDGRHLHPANKIPWRAAQKYAQWLGSITGEKYRLPTEAEWERAAKGELEAKYPWGRDTPSSSRANFATADTMPVTSFSSSATMTGKFQNMAGNVAEWCSDWYEANYYENSPPSNPTGPDLEGGRRDKKVIRGGGFLSRADELHTAYRSAASPDDPPRDVGFRLVK